MSDENKVRQIRLLQKSMNAAIDCLVSDYRSNNQNFSDDDMEVAIENLCKDVLRVWEYSA